MKKFSMAGMLGGVCVIGLLLGSLAGCGRQEAEPVQETQQAETAAEEARPAEEPQEGESAEPEVQEAQEQEPQESGGAEPGAQEAQEPQESQQPPETADAEPEVFGNPDELRWQVVNDIRIGWNLGNTLEAYGDWFDPDEPPIFHETCWGNPETTQEIIDCVLAHGFNAIRLPVSWRKHLDEDYNIDEAWMDRVQEVVDFAYGRGAYVILNTHHEDWNYTFYDNTDEGSRAMEKVWTQIAERFADYDYHLIFEAQNEPRKVDTPIEWTGDKEGREVVNAFNQVFVDTVRATGGFNAERVLMIPGYAASGSETTVNAIEVPEDDGIVISVHAYIPYDFALNKDGRAEWNEDKTEITNMMRLLSRAFLQKGIPVMLDEFGAMNKGNEEERIAWADYYLQTATHYGIPCFWWDNGCVNTDGENFGLIDRRGLKPEFDGLLAKLMERTESRAGAE